jgi:N-acetyl-gamma-glutamyl-phosphate reductase
MELLRLLLDHPAVEVVAVTSRSREGSVGRAHPHLLGLTRLTYTRETPEVLAGLAADCDVLFQAKPHGVSANETPALLEAAPALKVIDLSGDFRLRDPALYPTWYELEHPRPDWLARAAYGLPECAGREALRGARLVANPGCHATATILALWPLVRARLLAATAAVTSVTGSSGSGAEPKPGTHHPERFTNFKAYRPLHHQHLPEIVQALGGEARIAFVPFSAPVARGIYATALVPVGEHPLERVREAYRAAYEGEPFVRLLEAPPDLRAVVGTNLADVHVTGQPGTACVTVAIDNLGKGMAGAAVQNMNILSGLDEKMGLFRPGPGL